LFLLVELLNLIRELSWRWMKSINSYPEKHGQHKTKKDRKYRL
jgi:hypothetical protein